MHYRILLSMLNEGQREYIDELPWPGMDVYHILDDRMGEIICSLYDKGGYSGKIYLMDIGKIVSV